MKKYSVLFFLFFFFTQVNIAQEVRVIDNKGTIQKVNNNNVTYSDTAPTTPVEGDIWYDTNTSPSILKIRDGAIWRSLPSSNWDLTGNLGATAANFLGTIDDVKMQIRSNNTPMLEFGRRATLNLVVPNRIDYTNADQPLVFLKGDGDISALQFAASGAEFYEPMFFTTPNGSFRLKGSAGRTDFFEIGSAGDLNNGRLEFVIGDDGQEPIIFKRFYHVTETHSELFRVQGSENSADAKTRFGININPALVAVDATYNSTPAANNMANSTLQINGSVSKSILTTSAALTLTEDHHTIVLGGNHAITLPAANLSEGRIYVIKNRNATSTTISSYINEQNNTSTSVNSYTTIRLQSDGANWQQISGTYSGPTVYTGSFIIAAPGGSSTSTTSQTINGLPFKPSQITFTAHANVESLNFSSAGSRSNDVNNSFGTMNGFARDGSTITQQVIYVGGSGQSINSISRFASSSNCIGVRYGNQNGDDLGRITASLTSFNTNGFTISATHTKKTNNNIFGEAVVVLYTAYK